MRSRKGKEGKCVCVCVCVCACVVAQRARVYEMQKRPVAIEKSPIRVRAIEKRPIRVREISTGHHNVRNGAAQGHNDEDTHQDRWIGAHHHSGRYCRMCSLTKECVLLLSFRTDEYECTPGQMNRRTSWTHTYLVFRENTFYSKRTHSIHRRRWIGAYHGYIRTLTHIRRNKRTYVWTYIYGHL